MTMTAKVFSTGNSQAVRLPKAFRVNVREMWIARNEHTGEITLSPKPDPDALQTFLRELRSLPASDAFVPPRDDRLRAGPLADWPESPGKKRVWCACFTCSTRTSPATTCGAARPCWRRG